MEYLPVELLLNIFRYLHRFDILYSFNNLNQRFQRITEPYLVDIDLTQGNLSFRHFTLFCKHIVPTQGEKNRLLKLDGEHQCLLFHSHIDHLINLESLTLKSIVMFGCKNYPLVEHLFTEALKLNSLRTLSLSNLWTNFSQKIASNASQNLTTLTLLDQGSLDCSDEQWLKTTSLWSNISFQQWHMFTVKCFIANLHYFASTTLTYVFKVMPNLEELKLSMLNVPRSSEDDRWKTEVPKTLDNLHLEFKHEDQLSLEILRTEFLDVFKTQIRSLILIVTNAAVEFSSFDKLYDAVSDFTRLDTFQYRIRFYFPPDSRFPNVEQRPDSSYSIFTLPQPHSLRIISRLSRPLTLIFHQTVTLDELLRCSPLIVSTEHLSKNIPVRCELDDHFKMMNLTTLILDFVGNRMGTDGDQFLSKLATLSPNLHTLSVHSYDTETTIQQLKQFLPIKYSKKITHFRIGRHQHGYGGDHFRPNPTIYHTTFFHELSQLLPNLSTLLLSCTKVFTDQYLPIWIVFLQDLKSYFSRLTHFTVEIIDRNQDACDSLKNNLDQCSWLSYTMNDQFYEDFTGGYITHVFHIWL